MLLDDQYKIYAQGFQYVGTNNTGVQISIKKGSVYIKDYWHVNNNYLSIATMTVYYR